MQESERLSHVREGAAFRDGVLFSQMSQPFPSPKCAFLGTCLTDFFMGIVGYFLDIPDSLYCLLLVKHICFSRTFSQMLIYFLF